MIEASPNRPQKGRAAVSNRSGRYEAYQHIATFDGWEQATPAGEETRPATSVTRDSSRRMIARNQSPDVPFDRSLNPYRGCEHGCIYCFARPTHAWLGLSPGLDFETRLFAKPDAAELLRAELANPRYRPATLALGTATDPYQPVERGLEITRSLLAVLKEKFPSSSIRRVESVGPKVGEELTTAATIAVLASLASIMLYIWIRFQWRYSIGALVALFHDVLLVLAAFAFTQKEISLPVVAAVLTVAGYSINDTIVIFDRIRESLRRYQKRDLFDSFNLSLNQTLSRTVLTSGTTLAGDLARRLEPRAAAPKRRLEAIGKLAAAGNRSQTTSRSKQCSICRY